MPSCRLHSFPRRETLSIEARLVSFPKMQRHYPDIAFHVPTLLLPAPGIALESWAVIACDQHTSEPEYWEETRRLVGDSVSTLNLVLPEARLGRGDRGAAIAAINGCMRRYLDDGVLVPCSPGFMLVEREVGRASPRRGLVVALDLESFDYREGAEGLIRSTEGTDPGRLPARIEVRRDAPLETPHILVLIDDPGGTVIEPLFERGLELAYDFETMQGGGRVRGWRVGDGGLIADIAGRLGALRRGEPPLLYAMGDGNHSFAAARAVWEGIKASHGGAAVEHPGRYALVELVNVHDDGLEFAPIHRLLDGVDPAALFAAMAAHFEGVGFGRRVFDNVDQWRRVCGETGPGHRLPYVAGAEFGLVSIDAPRLRLATASLHDFLDGYLDRDGAASVDYIHGDETLVNLAGARGRVGFLLPAMNKHDLFKTVIDDGATPRKTFSLGEAHEKRYYLECRRI